MPFPAATPVSVGPDIELSVHDTGGEGPAVVFCHGFPDLACTWEHQLDALAHAGYRAIAPDMRGYGGSSAPSEVEAYGLTDLAGDLAGLLDGLGIDRAVFVGHDWGGFVSWSMPVLHSHRCLGAVGVCTPYQPFPTTDLLRTLVNGEDERMYMLWFQEPGVAEAVLDGQVELMYDVVMRGGIDPAQVAELAVVDGAFDMNPFRRLDTIERRGDLIIDDAQMATYVETFNRTGFGPGINWYRNIDANVQAAPDVGRKPLDLPCLMLCAEWDPALPPSMAADMPERCSDLEMHIIEQAGHFVQLERPDAVSSLLVDWLTRRFPPKTT